MIADVPRLVVARSASLQAPRPPPKQAVVETSAGTFVIDLAPEQAPVDDRVLHEDGRPSGGYDGHDLSQDDQVRHGAGRRSADEGSRQARAVRHRRTERGEGRAARGEDDARVGGRGHDARQSRQRRPAVLHRRRRSAGARRPVHRLRPRVGRHRGRAEDFGDAGRRQGGRDRARRDHARHDPRHAAGAVRQRDARRNSATYRAVLDTSAGPITIEFFPDKAPEHRAPVPAARRRPASTTAWRSIASRRASSFRPAR